MTELEIAKKYGVPTPETCKELGWKEETLFYWVYLTHWEKGIEYADPFLAMRIPPHIEHELDGREIERKEQIAVLAPSTPHLRNLSECKFYFPAPQIHELMAKMPTSILNDDGFDYFLNIDKNEVSYFSLASEKFLRVVGVSSKIGVTEALAQLYIKLRKEDLL